MTEKNKTDVSIGGRNFTVVGDESSEYVYKLAAHVDNKIKEMSSKNDKLNDSMASILTALNITDELYKVIQELDSLKERSKTPIEEYDTLKEQVKAANEEILELEAKYNQNKDELENVRRKNQQLKINNEKDTQALKLKEKELQDSQNMIKKLQDKIFDDQVQLIETKKELEEVLKLYDEEKSIFSREEV